MRRIREKEEHEGRKEEEHVGRRLRKACCFVEKARQLSKLLECSVRSIRNTRNMRKLLNG